MAEGVEAEVYEILLDLKIGENILKARSPPGVIAKIGDKLCLILRKDKMHIFDAKTENTII
jgi:hypothetical protein